LIPLPALWANADFALCVWSDGLFDNGSVSVLNSERLSDPVNGQPKNITGMYVFVASAQSSSDVHVLT